MRLGEEITHVAMTLWRKQFSKPNFELGKHEDLWEIIAIELLLPQVRKREELLRLPDAGGLSRCPDLQAAFTAGLS